MFENAKNVYDILAIAYQEISGNNEQSHINKFSENVTYLRRSIMDIISTFSENHNFNELVTSLNTWIKRNLSITKAACIAIIIFIDKILPPAISENKLSLSIVKKIGPLNIIQDKVYVLPISRSLIFEGLINIKNRNLQFHKRKNYDETSINKYLNNYILLDKIILNDYVPIVFKHNNSKEFLNCINGIRIAIIPFTCESFLDISFKEKTFSISGFINDYENYFLNKYTVILKNLMNKNIDIVIFPEMVLTQNILKKIRLFLNCQNNSLKLIICGTIWEDYSNICYVLSGSGDVILQQKKFSSYEYKFNGKSYSENLQDTNNKYIEVLDIHGLGRISTSICKDFINERLLKFFKVLKSNIVFIPAYSDSISDFVKNSNTIAADYHGITVLCNCCEPVFREKGHKLNQENLNVGYISLPCKEKETQKMATKFFNYSISDECRKKCKKLICSNIYTLYPKQILETDNIYSIKVDNVIDTCIY